MGKNCIVQYFPIIDGFLYDYHLWFSTIVEYHENLFWLSNTKFGSVSYKNLSHSAYQMLQVTILAISNFFCPLWLFLIFPCLSGYWFPIQWMASTVVQSAAMILFIVLHYANTQQLVHSPFYFRIPIFSKEIFRTVEELGIVEATYSFANAVVPNESLYPNRDRTSATVPRVRNTNTNRVVLNSICR